MLFKNYNEVATSRERKQALRILEAGVKGANAWELMSATVRFNKTFKSVTIQTKTFDLITGRIFVIGAGKAAGPMAVALEKIVPPEYITAGLVNCSEDGYKTVKIEVNKGGHPLPDKKGYSGVKKMLALKDEYKIGPKDLVICLISGGASALLPAPAEGISLKDKQDITELLIKSGATIQESNAVRKHLSAVKGGLLAQHFRPARVASIIISDVVGDTPDAIGSGPTVMDTTTFKDADIILEKYGLKKTAPKAVVSRIEAGAAGKIADTPKRKDLASHFIIGSNASALEAMAHEARNLKLKALIASSDLIGSPGAAARETVTRILSGDFEGYDVILWGGETTPTLPKKHGRGGRNQHFASVFLSAMKDYKKDWTFACMSTDGVDYIPGVSGAIIDQDTNQAIMEKKIDLNRYVRGYDSYSMLKKLKNSLLLADATGTNVRDVMLFIRK